MHLLAATPGAVGDGAADDFAAIQRAVDKASFYGGFFSKRPVVAPLRSVN